VIYAPAMVIPALPPGRRSIDQVLAEARARLDRLTPQQALRAVSAGAVLVDIRPAAQRAAEGQIPGALVVFCSEGYTSSLAAAALQDLGVRRATDLDGGFVAWQAVGLPVVLAAHSSDS